MKVEHRDRCIGGLMQSGIAKAQAEKLFDAGLWPVKRLRLATDEELLAIPGIGQRALIKVRAWAGGGE